MDSKKPLQSNTIRGNIAFFLSGLAILLGGGSLTESLPLMVMSAYNIVIRFITKQPIAW